MRALLILVVLFAGCVSDPRYPRITFIGEIERISPIMTPEGASETSGCTHFMVFRVQKLIKGKYHLQDTIEFGATAEALKGLSVGSRYRVEAQWTHHGWIYVEIKPMKPNQALQHNDSSCHVSCLRTPRASRGRG